jgi:capsular polysaccharide biosynthesis protein
MQNNDPVLAAQPYDEMSLLDILEVITDNIKLLVIGPILPVALLGGIS